MEQKHDNDESIRNKLKISIEQKPINSLANVSNVETRPNTVNHSSPSGSRSQAPKHKKKPRSFKPTNSAFKPSSSWDEFINWINDSQQSLNLKWHADTCRL